MKRDLFHPIVFHQASYNLQMFEGYILTTTRFPLVYLIDPFCNNYIEITPGKQDHITIDIFFNSLPQPHTHQRS